MMHKDALGILAQTIKKEITELIGVDQEVLLKALLAATLQRLTRNIPGGLPLYVAEIDESGEARVRQEGSV